MWKQYVHSQESPSSRPSPFVNPGGAIMEWKSQPQTLADLERSIFCHWRKSIPRTFFRRKLTCFDTWKFQPPKIKVSKMPAFSTKPLPTPNSFCWFFLPETNSFATWKYGGFSKKKKRKTSPFATDFSGGKITAISFKDWYWQNLFAQMQDQSSRQ